MASTFCLSIIQLGPQMTLLYSSIGRTKDLHSLSIIFESLHSKTLEIKPRMWLALLTTEFM